METSAVATACAEKLIRFISIRVISDNARTDLPKRWPRFWQKAEAIARRSPSRSGGGLRA